MRKISIILLVFVSLSRIMSGGLTQTIDEALGDLSEQIIASTSETNRQKIAIIEFSDLDGKITELGKFVSEGLVTRLVKSKKFNVVERQILDKVIEEHKLTLTGLIDEATAKEISKILGLDAICSGTITDLVNSVEINARIISTETGSILAAASVEIKKDQAIKNLMRKVIKSSVSVESSKKLG